MRREDVVNDELTLIQKTEGLTFGTDALLLAGYIGSGAARALEIGTGSGILPMLLAKRGKAKHITAVEVQESYAALARENIEKNGLSDRVDVLCADVRTLPSSMCGSFDLVFSNPPYYRKENAGKLCSLDEKSAARHELHGDIAELCAAAGRLLRFGGVFAAVYLPDRLCDLVAALRAGGIEPKRLTFVHADRDAAPSLVLLLGKRGGKPGLKVTPPFFIYEEKDHKKTTDDYETIYETGNFPERFTNP